MALFEIKDLKFVYPGAENPALDGIDVTVEEGEFILVCGRSGCGKTTLLRQLKTVLAPHGERSGEILFSGEPLEGITERRQASEIGYVLQNPDNQIVTDKVWHELAFGLENLGYAPEVIRLRVAEMASFFGIQNWFHKKVEELSGGQKQLLNLASVMAMQPKVLILDEPTAQLDPIAAGEFLDTVRKINRELGTTVIMTEHRLEEVFPLADKALILEAGRQTYYDTPRRAGKFLAGKELAAALPSAVQIYEQTGGFGECPLTVCEGRSWLSEHFGHCAKEINDTKEPEAGKDVSDRERPGEKETVLEAREIWFRYERELPDVIRDLSLEVKKGEFLCILGGNGTGKSTALSLLAGIRRPWRGRMLLEGKDVRKRKALRSEGPKTVMLPQDPRHLFVRDTVREDLMEMFDGGILSGRGEQRDRVEEIAEIMEIGHLMSMHPYDLSGGEQQRAALAKVLLKEPEILLLDEPTKGLDGYYKQKLAETFKLLKERGTAIVMVSHDIEFCAAYADRCALFFDGSIVSCGPAEQFFVGNSFYTTAANRMARHLFPSAITVKDVVKSCRSNRIQE